MAQELTIANLDPNALPAINDLFGGPERNDDLSSGVSASFPVLSFKGKVWRVKFKGEEKTVLNEDGDPVASLTAVLVKASPNVSKLYYEKKYAEGDDAAPTCFSLDGVKPDDASEKKQSDFCSTCPHNVWGSRVTENGNKTKACADNRRIAVVPYPDINNNGDGPMLLRVPPASLASLVKLKEQLEELKLPYQAVVVKIGFDQEAAYPKLVFKPVSALEYDTAKKIKDMMESESVSKMFTEVVDEGSEKPQTPQETPTQASSPDPESTPAPKEEAAQTPSQAPSGQAEEEPKTPKQVAASEGEEEEITEELGTMLQGILND